MKTIEATLERDGFIGRFYYAPQPSEETMLVLTGSHGGIALSEQICEQLRPAGCNLLAVGYWKLPGLRDTLTHIDLTYFDHIFAWLRSRLPEESRKLGLYGWSRGGELALLLASREPSVSLTVAAAPSFCLYNGLDGNHRPLEEPTWLDHGAPLPWFSTCGYEQGETCRRLAAQDGEERVVHHYLAALEHPVPEEAVIPVERIRGAVLLLSSRGDEIWPSTDACGRIMARLDAHDFPYPHSHVSGEICSHWVVPLTPEHSRSLLEREHPEECEGFRRAALAETLDWIRTWRGAPQRAERKSAATAAAEAASGV